MGALKLPATLILLFLSLVARPYHLKAQIWELYNNNYELVRKIKNDNIKILGNDLRISTSNDELKLLNNIYEPFLRISGTKVFQYLEPWIITIENGKFGALHEYGEEIFKPEFDHIATYFNLLLANKDNKYRLYDRGLKSTIDLGNFETAHIAGNGQIIAKTPEGYFLPLSGKPDYPYQSLESITPYVILAKEASGFGLINREGEYILNPVIDHIEYLGDNFFFAHDGNEFMLIRAMEIKADIRYTSYHRIAIEDGVILEYIHGKLRRVMKKDGILLDAVGMARVSKVGDNHYNVFFKDGKTGLLNGSGKWDVKPTEGIDQIFPGSEGLFGVMVDGKFGFVDQTGTVRISNRFDEIREFSEGLAAVRIGEKWGYINSLDQFAVPPAFDLAEKFFKGLAVVKKGSKSNLINAIGQELLPDYYDLVSLTHDFYYLTENDGKYGMVNPLGSEIASPQYQDIRRETQDRIILKKDGKYGMMMESGEFSLPLFYSNIVYDPGNEIVLAEEEFIPIVEMELEDKGKKRKKGA